MDLSGWILDDAGPEGIIGLNAYTIPSNSKIAARGYFVVDLPVGGFALDNMSGDSVRLFSSDKHLATWASYITPAAEDESFAMKFPGTYEWTDLVTKNAVNKFNDNLSHGITAAAQTRIKINEIFPGTDTSPQWLEIFNSGSEPVYLHDWIIDEAGENLPIDPGAFLIQSPIIYPGGLVVIMIPAGNFTIATGLVRLFNENEVLIDSVNLTETHPGQSYALVNGEWRWGQPSPNERNTVTAKISASAPLPADPEVENPAPVAVTGEVKGETLLPRTGNGFPLTLADCFALWAIIWYIYIRLNPRKEQI